MLAVRLDGIQRSGTVFPRSMGTGEREVRERVELGGSPEGVSECRRGSVAAEEGLIVHLQQVEHRGSLWFSGGQPVVWRCSSVMARYRGRRGRLDDVQETENRLLDLLGPADSRDEAWLSRTELQPGGGLRGERHRRDRMSKKETRRGCLGGRGEWCESLGELWVPFIGSGGSTGVMVGADMARIVPAKEGEGRSGLLAEGYDMLQRCAGAAAGGGLVWCSGGHARAAAVTSVSLRSGR
jgi:hypothetical protein